MRLTAGTHLFYESTNEKIVAKTQISIARGTSPFKGIINNALDYFSSFDEDIYIVNYKGKTSARAGEKLAIVIDCVMIVRLLQAPN